jgi:hypothetical protein
MERGRLLEIQQLVPEYQQHLERGTSLDFWRKGQLLELDAQFFDAGIKGGAVHLEYFCSLADLVIRLL